MTTKADLVATIYKCALVQASYPSRTVLKCVSRPHALADVITYAEPEKNYIEDYYWIKNPCGRGGEAVIAGSASLWYHLKVNLGIEPSWTPSDIDLWVPIPDDCRDCYERNQAKGCEWILDFCKDMAERLGVKECEIHPLGRYVKGVLDGWPIQIIPCLDNPLLVTNHFDLSPCRIAICLWRQNFPVILHPQTTNEDLLAGKMTFYPHEGYDARCDAAKKRIQRYYKRGFTHLLFSEDDATPFETISMYAEENVRAIVLTSPGHNDAFGGLIDDTNAC